MPDMPKMINALDVMKAFQEHRGDAIVTTSGTAGRHWPEVSTNERRDGAGGSLCAGPDPGPAG